MFIETHSEHLPAVVSEQQAFAWLRFTKTLSSQEPTLSSPGDSGKAVEAVVSLGIQHLLTPSLELAQCWNKLNPSEGKYRNSAVQKARCPEIGARNRSCDLQTIILPWRIVLFTILSPEKLAADPGCELLVAPLVVEVCFSSLSSLLLIFP